MEKIIEREEFEALEDNEEGMVMQFDDPVIIEIKEETS